MGRQQLASRRRPSANRRNPKNPTSTLPRTNRDQQSRSRRLRPHPRSRRWQRRPSPSQQSSRLQSRRRRNLQRLHKRTRQFRKRRLPRHARNEKVDSGGTIRQQSLSQNREQRQRM